MQKLGPRPMIKLSIFTLLTCEFSQDINGSCVLHWFMFVRLVHIISTCWCNIFWDLHFYPVSWLGIPVSSLPCLALVKISSTGSLKTLLSHSFQMLILEAATALSLIYLLLWFRTTASFSNLHLGSFPHLHSDK